MKKIDYKRLFIAAFLVIPLILLAAIVISPDRGVSESENRMLTRAADLDGDVLGGGFQEWLENYLSDQFPMRERLKSAEVGFRLITGSSCVGGAYIGADGRLFQKVLDSDVDVERCRSYAERINSVAVRTGLDTYVMYVPSAGISLRNWMPYGAPMYDYDALYRTLCQALPDVRMIDLRQALAESPDYYYATDHHWTGEGAARAYYEWRLAHGQEVGGEYGPQLVAVSDDFRGTLWSRVPSESIPGERMLAPVLPDDGVTVAADGMEMAMYDYSALATKDKYNFFQGGNHGILTVRNENASTRRKLLIFKDSFANSFLPFLVGDYAEIVMVDERYAFEDAAQMAEMYGVDEIAVIREITSFG